VCVCVCVCVYTRRSTTHFPLVSENHVVADRWIADGGCMRIGRFVGGNVSTFGVASVMIWLASFYFLVEGGAHYDAVI